MHLCSSTQCVTSSTEYCHTLQTLGSQVLLVTSVWLRGNAQAVSSKPHSSHSVPHTQSCCTSHSVPSARHQLSPQGACVSVDHGCVVWVHVAASCTPVPARCTWTADTTWQGGEWLVGHAVADIAALGPAGGKAGCDCMRTHGRAGSTPQRQGG